MSETKVPSEAQALAAIEKAVGLLSHSFVFGYFDLDDIRQEARRMGLEALPRYDGKRPLENFLYAHIKNRLINFKRDKWRRTDPPCNLCHGGRQHEHPDGVVCDPYRVWQKRNSTKSNLLRPLDLENVSDEREASLRDDSSVDNDAASAELLRLIDAKLPVELRSTYLKMLAREPNIPKAMRLKVEAAVRGILMDSGEEVS